MTLDNIFDFFKQECVSEVTLIDDQYELNIKYSKLNGSEVFNFKYFDKRIGKPPSFHTTGEKTLTKNNNILKYEFKYGGSNVPMETIPSYEEEFLTFVIRDRRNSF